MKIYSKDFMNGIKHYRIQQIVKKRLDTFYSIPDDDIGIATEIDYPRQRILLEFDEISSWLNFCDCIFIPEVYNSKNVFRSLLGMIGKNYNIISFSKNGKTFYEIKVAARKNPKEMVTFKGTDFQMLLLEAAIYKKTGESWRKSKQMWITKLENSKKA